MRNNSSDESQTIRVSLSVDIFNEFSFKWKFFIYFYWDFCFGIQWKLQSIQLTHIWVTETDSETNSVINSIDFQTKFKLNLKFISRISKRIVWKLLWKWRRSGMVSEKYEPKNKLNSCLNGCPEIPLSDTKCNAMDIKSWKICLLSENPELVSMKKSIQIHFKTNMVKFFLNLYRNWIIFN